MGVNNTVTIKQADSLIKEVDGEMGRAYSSIINCNRNFLDELAKLWEDQNLYDFINSEYKESMKDIVDGLSKNNKTFGSVIKDIGDAYAKTGGNSDRVSETPQSYSSGALTFSQIKNKFPDDSIGWISDKVTKDSIMEPVNTFIKDMKTLATNLNSNISKKNAFGSTEVRNNLGKTGAAMATIIHDSMDALSTAFKQITETAEQQYSRVTTEAASAADVKVESKQ